MLVRIEPQPSEEERDAILAALTRRGGEDDSGWATAALLEGVEERELDEP